MQELIDREILQIRMGISCAFKRSGKRKKEIISKKYSGSRETLGIGKKIVNPKFPLLFIVTRIIEHMQSRYGKFCDMLR